MSIKLNTNLNAEVSHYPSTAPLSGERAKPPAKAMNLQAVAAQVHPKLRKTITKIMASLALSTVVALVPMVAQARPFMTWNLNGATNGGQQSWERIFQIMNDPGLIRQPIDIAAIQEAGVPTGLPGIAQLPDDQGGTIQSNGGTIKVFQIVRGGVRFVIYWTLGDLTATRRNALAIVLRNPVQGEINPVFVPNPLGPLILGENVALDRNRPALGVRDTTGVYYFTFHAAATLNGNATNNDASLMANAIDDAATANNGGVAPRSLNIGADLNRGLTNIAAAFPAGQLREGLTVTPSDQATYNARRPNPDRFLDGLIARTESRDPIAPGRTLNNFGGAFTDQHPSDHFAVLFDDRLASYDNIRELDRGKDGQGFTIVDKKSEKEREKKPDGRTCFNPVAPLPPITRCVLGLFLALSCISDPPC